jgi:hypothetical protein
MNIDFLAPPVDLPPYLWLIKVGPRKLGIHQHKGWCMQVDEQVVFFDSEDKCVPLAPILEVEGEKLFEFLQSAALVNSSQSECINKFPKVLLLKHVFHTSFSGYWPERALGWLGTDKAIQPLFRDELERFVQNKTMPQGARQKAKRIVQSLSLC